MPLILKDLTKMVSSYDIRCYACENIEYWMVLDETYLNLLANLRFLLK